ncbi:MAG: ABC transporter permease [Tannerellaceae bacterium]|nr:ABC transporter permease [Tannerellaceae bacterium]
MKYLIMAFRSLRKKGRSNGIKILSLAVGMAMGLVLISKVIFEFTYDDFFPDKERIYMVNTNSVRGDEEPREYPQVSGAIAPGMKREIAEVEVATRFTWLGDFVFKTLEDNHRYKGLFILADTCFFDVLPFPVIAGDIKDVLSRPMYVMISEKLANAMGGVQKAMGSVIESDSAPGKMMTIGGVFKDLPENTHLRYDVIVSLNSIGNFMGDGTENWLGNDRYRAYVKLYPGVDPESLAPAIRQMQERNQPLEQLANAGLDLTYTLSPLEGAHARLPEVKRMALLMGLIALALIFTAIMNYILIVLSGLVGRTKEMAVYKSYGADGKEIMKIMMTETAVHLFISLLLSVFLIFLLRGKIVEILGVSIVALFSLRTLLIIVLICLVVFLISGIIPSILYARIPVASAFRNFKESRRNWKLGSLFVQFVAMTFLIILLSVIWKQYNLMINDNPGYNPDKLLYCETEGVTPEKRQTVLLELSRMPVVKSVATATTLPFYGASGNNVWLPGEDKELFNLADLYWVDQEFFSVMEIPLLEGSSFSGEMADNACMVDRKFAEKISLMTGWTDGVVGKEVFVSEHGLSHICGVYESIRVGTIEYEDFRPTILFYRKNPAENPILIIQLHEMTPENIQAVVPTIERLLPTKEIHVNSFKLELVNLYNSSRLFRDSVIIGGIVVLLISIIGLIGYLQDEINRRKSEIAIRRINGGTVKDILGLFVTDILYIALPALVLGCLIAYYAAVKWQEDFTEKTNLSFFLFLGCSVVVLVIIVGVIITSSYRKAQENPVESLRSE